MRRDQYVLASQLIDCCELCTQDEPVSLTASVHTFAGDEVVKISHVVAEGVNGCLVKSQVRA